MPHFSSTVSPEEVAQFAACAGEWWQPDGAFSMLHELMPLRLDYIGGQITQHLSISSFRRKPESSAARPRGKRLFCAADAAQLDPGLRRDDDKEAKQKNMITVLDIGCGGGLIAEEMAAEGYTVTGLDAAAEAIEVARAHAATSGLTVDYRVGTAEGAAQAGERYDVILALEIVEHVQNLKAFVAALSALLKPDGLVIVSTMNRTMRSYLLGILAAEYVLGWVPPGTHDWDQLVKPSELAALFQAEGIAPVDITGCRFHPLSRRFTLEKGHTAINYFMAGQKAKTTP